MEDLYDSYDYYNDDDKLVYPDKYSRASKHKTTLCSDYDKNGFCKFGDRWFRAHGKRELRAYDDPVKK